MDDETKYVLMIMGIAVVLIIAVGIGMFITDKVNAEAAEHAVNVSLTSVNASTNATVPDGTYRTHVSNLG